MIEIPAFTKDATYGEIMAPAIKIAEDGDTELGRKYVEAYVQYLMQDWGHTEKDAYRVVLNNIGYWAGYYGHETMKLVHEFYGAEHPVFGASQPTTKEAFDAGVKYMAKND